MPFYMYVGRKEDLLETDLRYTCDRIILYNKNMAWKQLVVELTVSNFDKSLSFYVDILGFEIKSQRENPHFAYLEFEASQIMIEQYYAAWSTGSLEYPYGRGVNLQIDCKDIEKLQIALSNANYSLFRVVQETWYDTGEELVGVKELLVQDVDGYLLRFQEEVGSKR